MIFGAFNKLPESFKVKKLVREYLISIVTSFSELRHDVLAVCGRVIFAFEKTVRAKSIYPTNGLTTF